MKLFNLSLAKTLAKKVNAKLKLYYKSEYKYYTGSEQARIKAQTDRYADMVSAFILRYITETGCLPSDSNMFNFVNRMALSIPGDPMRDIPSEYELDYKNLERTENILHIVAPKLYERGLIEKIEQVIIRDRDLQNNSFLSDCDPYDVACRLFDLRFVGANVNSPLDVAYTLFAPRSITIKVSSSLKQYLGGDSVYTFKSPYRNDLAFDSFSEYLSTDPDMCKVLLDIALDFI